MKKLDWCVENISLFIFLLFCFFFFPQPAPTLTSISVLFSSNELVLPNFFQVFFSVPSFYNVFLLPKAGFHVSLQPLFQFLDHFCFHVKYTASSSFKVHSASSFLWQSFTILQNFFHGFGNWCFTSFTSTVKVYFFISGLL